MPRERTVGKSSTIFFINRKDNTAGSLHQQPSPPDPQPKVHPRLRSQLWAINADPSPPVHTPPKQGLNSPVKDLNIRTQKCNAMDVSIAGGKNAR